MVRPFHSEARPLPRSQASWCPWAFADGGPALSSTSNKSQHRPLLSFYLFTPNRSTPLVPAVTRCLLCLLLLCVSLQNTCYYLVCAFYFMKMIHALEISLLLLFFIQYHVLKHIHVHIHVHLVHCFSMLPVCPWDSGPTPGGSGMNILKCVTYAPG